jgi:hypothetical protein
MLKVEIIEITGLLYFTITSDCAAFDDLLRLVNQLVQLLAHRVQMLEVLFLDLERPVGDIVHQIAQVVVVLLPLLIHCRDLFLKKCAFCCILY